MLASLLPIAACAGPTISRDISWNDDAVLSHLTYLGAQGAVPVTVRGNPLSTDPASFNQLLVGAMRGRNAGPVVTFAIGRGDEPGRVVFLVDAAPQADGRALCADLGSAPTRPSEGNLRVQGAFCFGANPLSEAAGEVSGRDSGSLAALFGHLTYAMFRHPRRDLDMD